MRTAATLLVVTAELLATIAAGAQSSGIVLQLPASARAAALGNAYVAAGQDDAMIFYNPAQLEPGVRRQSAASASVQRYAADAHVAALSVARRLGPGHVGLGLQLLDYGSIPEIIPDPDYGGERGRETGARISARDFAASLGYGMPVTSFRLGATAKVVQQQVADLSGATGALDLGVATGTPLGLLAFAMQNSGGLLKVGSTTASLPLVYRAGIEIFPMPIGRTTLVNLLEWSKARGGSFVFSGGSELVMPAGGYRLSARAGLRPRRDKGSSGSRLTLGGGVASRGFAIDYGYQTIEGMDVGTHRVGVRWWR